MLFFIFVLFCLHAAPSLCFRPHVAILRRFSLLRLAEPSDQSVTNSNLLLVQTGVGCDCHGQNSTKAAIRACKNAIVSTSFPAIGSVVPGGYKNMTVRVEVAVPDPETVDIELVVKVFPYGKIHPSVIDGGMRGKTGIVIHEMGDKNDDMIIAIAAVYVEYPHQ